MKHLAIALLIFGVPFGAQAQAVNGIGFTPPGSVPTFQNLGGVLGGVSTGVNQFTIAPVNSIGLFHNSPGLISLGVKSNFIIGLARPSAP